MNGLFKEKIEYLKARFRSTEGIFEWLIGSFIWGYIIVRYNQLIFSYIFNLLPLSSGILKSYLSYLIFGLVLTPIGILITYILTKIYHTLFKRNKKF